MGRKWTAVLTVLVLFSTLGALADQSLAAVRFKGKVQVWNHIENKYVPLPAARIRIVLAEYYDWDTFDVETTTSEQGYFNVKKSSNAWWRNGYDYYAIVFAESPGKLEIQEYYFQIDGYQAVFNSGYAGNNKTKELELRIGGTQSNVKRYQAGGLACLDTSFTLDNAQRGWRAFFICRETTDHRLRLQSMALSGGHFEEKELTYPYDGSNVGRFDPIINVIRIPDTYFAAERDPKKASLVCRHELSHGIMADEYWMWPGWWDMFVTFVAGGSFSHSLDTVSDSREAAWSEGWAEFLAEVTQRPRYGMFNDLENTDAGWRSGIPAGAARDRVEGEVASVLWDLHDGMGWERRNIQVEPIPGVEMFYDGVSDYNLTKIWSIVESYHPYSVVGATSTTGGGPSIIHYWLHQKNYGQKHQVKAIVYNRGINGAGDFVQNAPAVTVGAPQWDGATVKFPVTVKELDPEDRPHVWLETFVDKVRTEQRKLEEGWSGSEYTTEITQEVAWVPTRPKPVITIAVHDDMQSDFKRVVLQDIPATAMIDGLKIEILAVKRTSTYAPNSMLGDNPPVPTLSNAKLSVRANAYDQGVKEMAFPRGGGNWNIGGQQGTRVDSGSDWVLGEYASPPTRVSLRFWAEGRLSDGVNPGTTSIGNEVKVDLSLDNMYKLGTHTVRVLGQHIPVVNWDWSIEVVYRISAVRPQVKLVPGVIALKRLGVHVIPAGGMKVMLPQPKVARPESLSPVRLASKAARLTDDYARLQAEVLQIAQELEYKLNHPRHPAEAEKTTPVRRPVPGVRPGPRRVPRGPVRPVRKPPGTMLEPARKKLAVAKLAQPEGHLRLPALPYLDQALSKDLAIKSLTAAQRAHLTELRAALTERQKRIGTIETELATLRPKLRMAATRFRKEVRLPEAHRKRVAEKLDEIGTRIDKTRPTTVRIRAILAKQQRVVQKGLTLPPRR